VLHRLTPGSKWRKHVILYRHEHLRQYLPETEPYSQAGLVAMLERHEVVFVKPVYGGGGELVYRVQRLEDGTYRVSMKRMKAHVPNLDKIDSWVQSAKRVRFIMQQGIDLAPWNGRFVDLRTIVQRDERQRFEVTGRFAKRAGKRLDVTNVHAGGEAHKAEHYLTALGYSREEQAELVRELTNMSLAICRCFEPYRNAIYGLDIGLDKAGCLWLIEINTDPRLDIFHRLGLRRMFVRSRKLWQLHSTVNLEAREVRMAFKRKQKKT